MKYLSLAACGTVFMLAVTGCAGSAGQSSAAEDSGYEFGASQDEIDAVLADLEPVTLTYQSVASSPNSVMAHDTIFAEEIEERSGGKITVDVVYGQAIAGFDEIHDALADGRVDLAYTLPAADPSRFPIFDELSYPLSALSSSPLVGELVANAVGVELGWESEELLEEFESQGLVPLFPISASANAYPSCTEEAQSAEDWEGRQIRAGSSAHETIIRSIGATPVSLSYVEVYEALQRKTADCAMNSFNSSFDHGFFEVAPHVSYTADTSALRAPGAVLGGSKIANLPLAYQQVVFDSLVGAFIGGAEVVIDGNYEGVAKVNEVGGTIKEMDPEVQESIMKANRELIAEIEDNGTHGSDLRDRVIASGEKWTAKAEELGFVDEGDFASFDEWYDEDTDFRPYADAVYEEVLLEHRPE
ncbi:hypothetical protein GCM10023190_18150 [Enteractinococcus fodinae]|uniref:TRAP-type C4-dicarboxylate transport system substrate-binding protein n=1 Tax=Enteractinococcus fodinae TaxID=684663 RepID=A0ABU2B605_9MICC|nr:TRAP transporter substrate-binding protein DctP [Enteractinococcus fodinae]MDR7348424.1 TRAP-type C4-dicarboxylate transport system substrate-binding protein [Enteractinococcus fodinae]